MVPGLNDSTIKCVSHSIELANSEVEIKEEDIPSDIDWPFESMWEGQGEAVKTLSETDKTMWLCSPTGSGKSPIIVSTARNRNKNGDIFGSMIIVPRKALQDQFKDYDVFPVFGKANYKCELCGGDVRANDGPCNAKTSEGMFCPIIDDWCKDGNCRDCPCTNCQYFKDKKEAKNLLVNKGTICCNAWNFLLFLSYASNVFVDEADLVFNSLCSAKKLYNVSIEYKDEGIDSLLIRELMEIQRRLAEISVQIKGINNYSDLRDLIKKKNALENHENAINFLNENRESCFKYVQEGYIHVEVKPMDVDVLLRRYFKDKKMVLVSATPFSGHFDSVSYEIPHKSAIYYNPVGKMTVTHIEINKNFEVLNRAINEISETYKEYRSNNLTRKAVIHCGRLKWAEEVGEKLRGKGYKVRIHEQGEQRATVDNFRSDDSDFVCLVAAEYGIDFNEDDIRLQFILKVPYAPQDERIEALEKEKGYRLWQKKDAIQKLVQASGRVARGNKFSATYILDQKFNELYKQFETMLPEWFKDRLYYAKNL